MTMNEHKAAAALNTIALGLGELAEALNESGPARPVAGRAGVGSPAALPAPTFSDGLPVEEPPLFPDAFEDGDYQTGQKTPDRQPQPSLADASTEFHAPAQTEQDRVLSECPVHLKPWTIKEGGMSKNGKPYSAFWKCSGKNADGSYCDKKPDKGWAKTHDPEKALAAA